MDLIDRKTVLEELNRLHDSQTMSKHSNRRDLENVKFGIHLAHNEVLTLPKVDTMRVIRCKDCKYFGNIGEVYFDYAYPTCFCKHYKWEDSSGWAAEIEPDDGCSYGERRGD